MVRAGCFAPPPLVDSRWFTCLVPQVESALHSYETEMQGKLGCMGCEAFALIRERDMPIWRHLRTFSRVATFPRRRPRHSYSAFYYYCINARSSEGEAPAISRGGANRITSPDWKAVRLHPGPCERERLSHLANVWRGAGSVHGRALTFFVSAPALSRLSLSLTLTLGQVERG